MSYQDETSIRRLEDRAYYAVVRALAASNKLTFDTEALLMDLQSALNVDDERSMALVTQTENDPEIAMLKQYDSSINKAAMGGGMQASKPQAARAASGHPGDTPFGQPAVKKQKKSQPGTGGATAAPMQGGARPLGGAGQAAVRAGGSGAAGAGGGGGGGAKPRNRPGQQRTGKPGGRAGISATNFQRIMAKGAQDEMEGYLQELNAREREIFTELISQGVQESDPDLNDVHRELLRWYKLDQRQSALAHQLTSAV